MANIDEYIKQIQQARYGEEVRDSIVNALKKVNDDNNSYVAIKKEVVAAKDIVEEKAEIFDEKANAAKETLTALQASTQIANEAKSSLNNIISSAISTKKELEQAVLETGEVIARVDNAKSNLDKSITSAGKAELNLQRQIETSNQIKNQLDVGNSTAIELKKNLDMAINEANTAKVKLVEAINNAGNTAVENIKTAQNTATQAVETAKTEAVKAVQTEGTTQTGAVTAEGEKQVQAVQTAAQEIIADREQIAKNKTDIAELRQKKADAIVENVRGTLLNVKDSANAFFEDFSVYGKSEQVQTTGKNILNIPNIDMNTPETVIECNISKDICISVQEKATVTQNIWRFLADYKDGSKKYINDSFIPNTFSATPENPIVSIQYRGTYITSGAYRGIMVEYGTTATTYEPYTGGKPSPSPEYPQEIKNSGKWNEETQKYEVDVKVSNKNLFDLKRIKNGFVKSTGNGFDIVEDNMYPKSIYLDIIIPLKAGQTLNISGVEQDVCRIRVKHDTGNYYLKYTANKYTEIIICFYSGLTDENKKTILIEISDTPTNYEPYKEQTITLQTPNGLPGLKVDGNGNYTDENGQQWIADEIDLARGKYVQRIGERIFDGTEAWEKYKENQYSLPKWADKKDKMIAYTENKYYLCNIARIKNKDSMAIGEFSTHLMNQGNGWILFGFAGTLEEWKQYLTTKKAEGNPVTVQYILAEPVETDLPPEIIAAFKKLHTNYPTTIVTNSEDAEMQLTYVADTKNYTDNKIKEAVSAQVQNLANLLSLMPLSTQAAMIEADTNNILDNMEVQK